MEGISTCLWGRQKGGRNILEEENKKKKKACLGLNTDVIGFGSDISRPYMCSFQGPSDSLMNGLSQLLILL